MGDRAMAEIKVQGGSFYIYTHWGGQTLLKVAMDAILAARPRWNDTPYAARIIFDQLTKEGRDQENGYGLMLGPTAEDEYNNNKPSVIIDLLKQELIAKYSSNSLANSVTIGRVTSFAPTGLNFSIEPKLTDEEIKARGFPSKASVETLFSWCCPFQDMAEAKAREIAWHLLEDPVQEVTVETD